MERFCIEIAGFVFSVKIMFSRTYGFCKEYVTDKSPDYFIEMTAEDTEKEKQRSERQGLHYNSDTSFALFEYECTALYRKIAEILLSKKAIVFHGALIQKDGKGYLFTAKSGTGKTTHILNWKSEYPDCRIINGDKPIIIYRDNCFYGYGTPWSGKEKYQENDFVKIDNIILLERGNDNVITEISFSEALPNLISQCNLPHGQNSLSEITLLLCEMNNKIKFYRLLCNTDASSAKTAFDGMSK